MLLPKDYLRLWLTGEHISEMSDSAGTSWLDIGKRKWSPNCSRPPASTKRRCHRWSRARQKAGKLRAELALEMGHCGEVFRLPAAPATMRPRPAAWARSAHGAAFVSLGTSGVLFAANGSYLPKPESAVHAFCHALPNTWHQMGVILSATDALNWHSGRHRQIAAELTGELGETLKAPIERDFPALSLGRAHAAQRRRHPRRLHRPWP